MVCWRTALLLCAILTGSSDAWWLCSTANGLHNRLQRKAAIANDQCRTKHSQSMHFDGS